MSFSPGENVGAYRIIEQLGSGGMATVYNAFHAALDRNVAIKVIHPALKGDENFLSRFQREARVVARLEHPAIVPVYDFSEYDGSPFLVMRFVEGETLKARLNRGRLTLPEILDVIRPMGEALTYAHNQGVLHRDIKPSNVLLADDGRVFLTDFGLARIVQSGESSLTRDALVGTPYYISPEQAIGKSALDARTDIYSFGVVLYELFTGRVPFQADTPFAVIHDHIYTPLPLPSSVNPNLSPALEQVLLKALAKEPADRYRSASELVAAVEESVTGVAAIPPARPAVAPVPDPADAIPSQAQPSAAHPVRSSATARSTTDGARGRFRLRPLLLIAGALGLVAVLAVAGILLLADRGGNEIRPEPPKAPTVDEPPAREPAEDQNPPVGNGDLMRQAFEMASDGDLEAAIGLFEDAIGRDPKANLAYIEFSRILMQRGNIEAGLHILRQGTKSLPEDIDLHLALAQTLVYADIWGEAVPQFEWLIERAPDLAEPHAYMSVHLAINEDNLEGAEQQAAEALRLNPESAEAHFAMGVVHWRAGDRRRARFELERAQRLPNASPLLQQRIQRFLERLDEPESDSP